MEKTSCKYEVIQETLQASPDIFNLTALCELAGVSRSGYYAWIKAAPAREKREARDRAAAGPTAPAHGLTLMEIRYPEWEDLWTEK